MNTKTKCVEGFVVLADAQPDVVLARVFREILDVLDDHPLALPAAMSLYVEGLGPDGAMDHPEDVEVTGPILAEIWDHENSRSEWLELARERIAQWEEAA